jgi:hypothetical protein
LTHETTTTADVTKDLKVRIPVEYHIQLRTLKILKGKSMSHALSEALDLYFENNQEQATGVRARLLIVSFDDTDSR